MNKTSIENRSPVIVRGFAGEPAKLFAVRRIKGFIEVANQDATASICMKEHDVYEFDETTFKKLVAAFENGNGDALSKLWGVARRYER